jgi:hypothetical protein
MKETCRTQTLCFSCKRDSESARSAEPGASKKYLLPLAISALTWSTTHRKHFRNHECLFGNLALIEHDRLQLNRELIEFENGNSQGEVNGQLCAGLRH